MNKKEKAPTREATRAEAWQEKRQGVTAISCNYLTTTTADRQQGFIESLLSHGAENGLTLSDLHRLTGVEKRTIRAQIQQERLSGVPILSNNLSGYFLPANEQERKQCIRSLRHRAGEILKTAEAIERGGLNE